MESKIVVPKEYRRIAVLPLDNISPEKADDYFAEGLTEELISTVSKIAKLRVIARTSVMRYRKTTKTAREIGKELDVLNLLEGTVRKIGNKLRVSVQLVDALTEERLWSREYDREMRDAFEIQRDIAKKIAESLKIRLVKQEKIALEKEATRIPEAYSLYLKGRFYWNKRTEESLNQAIRFFEEALVKDPRYALAHTGVADSFATLALFEFVSPKEAFPKARAHAEEALEQDPDLAEALTPLGLVLFQYEHDWIAAEKEFLKAIELNPNYAPAHQFFADYLKAMGRFDEALTQMRQAHEIDPFSQGINTGIGHVLYLSRQYDRAIEQYRKTLRMDPNFVQAKLWFGRPFLQKGMFAEAIKELEEAVALSESTMSLAVLGHAYASSGKKEQALKILERLFSRSKERYLPSYWITLVYIGLGENEKAFEWLERAFQDSSSWLVWMKVEPRFDSIRSDPRFDSILKKMHLDQTPAPRGKERRSLAAIMFTDMVGYTGLTQGNEALALRLLEEEERLVRGVLPKYNGSEIKTIGDSFLVEFPSALEAILCAVEIQKLFKYRNAKENDEKKRLFLRIGIHVGDVIHRDADVFGDAVNIASRIQPLAKSGGICISRQVYDQVANKVNLSLREVNKPSLKNITFPTTIYEVETFQAEPLEQYDLGQRIQLGDDI